MAPRVVTKEALVAGLPPVAAIMDAMQLAYCQYSAGQAWVAPVSHVLVEGSPGGEACIKSGYVKGEASWVVKVAGGFSGNAALGLSNSQGVMLLFSQRTGELEAVLCDGGHLTDVRTAAAAVLCVREFKPRGARSLAVIGTGVIAKLVVEYAAGLFEEGEAELLVVSRTAEAARSFCNFAATKGWRRTTVATSLEVAACADVIVTCTPATAPVLLDVKRGALVVALGADVPGKRELGPRVLEGDDVLLLVDSKAQCLEFGEAAYKPDALDAVELGDRFSTTVGRRANATVVCDLTGVAVQDVAIATTVAAAVAAADAPPAPPALAQSRTETLFASPPKRGP